MHFEIFSGETLDTNTGEMFVYSNDKGLLRGAD